ncbi:MAG: CHAD domain-containing protein [Anaerolineae bacterium]
MSEAGRKTFRFHYRRMLYNEPGTRWGEDIEALHDMRVATRRMRAAFRVFGSFYERETVAPFRKGLKRTGRALGRVRDLDVFRAKIHTYLNEHSASEEVSLDGLLAELEARRDVARRQMIDYLDSERYIRLVEGFGLFVETEGMGSRRIDARGSDPAAYRVRHVAPVMIYERLAAVRAYDEWVSMPNPPLKRLHALRIACKRLRYCLEFFAEVLAPGTQEVIKEIVAVQDHLGAVQDAVVADGLLRNYVRRGTWGGEMTEPDPRPPADAPGVELYIAAKQAELAQLVESFPEVWQRIQEPRFSRLVAETVMSL